MMTVMKDSLEGQLDRAWAPLHKSNSCVLAATFGLGSWSIVFSHWKVYRPRAIDVERLSLLNVQKEAEILFRANA